LAIAKTQAHTWIKQKPKQIYNVASMNALKNQNGNGKLNFAKAAFQISINVRKNDEFPFFVACSH